MPTVNPNHPEWKGFVAAMRLKPGDDSIRLGFADFVQEQGADALAGLIRTMVRVSEIDPTNQLGTMGWEEKKAIGTSGWKLYEDALRFLHSTWALWSPLKDLHMDARSGWRFHRGFPDLVYLDWKGLDHLDKLCAIGPVGEVVVVAGAPLSWRFFPSTIQFTLNDLRLSRLKLDHTLVIQRSNVVVSLNARNRGLVHGAATHFLTEMFGEKVQRIRYEMKPGMKVWPTKPGDEMNAYQTADPDMDRLNHSG